MALSAFADPGHENSRREGFDVLLPGEDWTMTEVLRMLGVLAPKLELELSELRDGTHLIAVGPPETLIAAVTAMPVLGTDRDRVLRRLIPLTRFTEDDVKAFRSPSPR